MVVLKPNVVRGGRAIGLGNNLYLMKGRTHSKGGIDIGKNPKTGLEVENNEVMQVSPQGVRVFSAQPILGGISPAQYILGGANPNQVFNAQEQWKKVNRINDDGTKKARFGTPISPSPNIIQYAEGFGESLKNKNFAKKVVKFYKKHSSKIPDKVHKIVYDTLKDTAFSGNMSDIVYNVRHNIKNEVNSDNVFLMPQDRQQKALEKLGYKKIEGDDYGLVNAAVQKYKEATGREVPIYQKGEDEITREELIPLDNADLYSPTGSFREVITPWGTDGAETKVITDNEDIGDTANTPTRYYRDKNGNIYVKSWDFFDHGNYSRTDYNNEVRGGYVTRALTDLSQEFGNLLDEAGNPFVKTTGYKKVYPSKEPIVNGDIENNIAKEKLKRYNDNKNSMSEDLIRSIIGYDYFEKKYKGDVNKAIKDIFEGKYDIKKFGGRKIAQDGTEEKQNNNDRRYTRDEQWRLNNQHKLDSLVNSSKHPIIIGTNLNEEGFVDNHLGRWNGKNRRDSSSIKVDSLMWNGNPKNKIKNLNDEEYRGNFGLDNITKEELDKVGLSDLKDSLVFHKPFDGDSLQTIRKLTPEQAIKIMDAKIDSSFINLENQFGKDSVEIFFKNNPNAKNELGRVLYRMPNKFKTKGYINWLKNNKKENTISNFYNFLLNGKRINTSIEQVRKYIDENAIGPRKQDGSFKYGGIHIKPSKRGTFTAAAKKHGMSVQGFASKVLANKGKYSSAMVKKANFARNASKWKHKEFGGDMDFNYWITKDNIYKLGGRKKGELGLKAGQWGLQDYSNSFKVNLQPFTPTTVPATTLNVNNALALGIPNIIGAGLNLAGNIGSYFVNRRALRSMQAPVAPSAPTPLRAENLETRVSTAAQEAALRENVAKQENIIAGNLSSSRSRLNAVNAIRNQGIGLYNQLQERKQNVQTELINRAKLNRQQINSQNTLLANQYKDKVTNWRNNVIDFENKRKDALSENTIQHLIQGPIDAIAGERGFFANLENNKRYRISAFLNAIGNPYAVKAMKSGEFLPLAKQFGLTENDLKRFGLM